MRTQVALQLLFLDFRRGSGGRVRCAMAVAAVRRPPAFVRCSGQKKGQPLHARRRRPHLCCCSVVSHRAQQRPSFEALYRVVGVAVIVTSHAAAERELGPGVVSASPRIPWSCHNLSDKFKQVIQLNMDDLISAS